MYAPTNEPTLVSSLKLVLQYIFSADLVWEACSRAALADLDGVFCKLPFCVFCIRADSTILVSAEDNIRNYVFSN